MHSIHDHNDAALPGGGDPDGLTVIEPVDPLAEARQLLADHEQGRRQACAAELADVLGRHGFDFQVTPAQIVLVHRDDR